MMIGNRFSCSDNGWTNSEIALNWLTRIFDPQTREKAAGRRRFLFIDGHSSHLSLHLLRKAREFNIDVIIYPSHCTHLLQGLDVVCFAPLKHNWAEEIRSFEKENNRGITKNDFAGAFGSAYVKTFTRELILQAWETTGIYPFNDKIIPPEKLAPSETSTIKYTSCVVHSTPVRKVMEAFSYFKPPPLDLGTVDIDDGGELTTQERGKITLSHVAQMANEAHTILDPENPFLMPFTPSRRMKILRASLTSNSATSYLVSTSPVPMNIPIITPQHEQPEPFSEPDWDALLAPQITCMGAEELVCETEKLRRGLQMARDCLRAREAVIESAHATNVVLELTCQRQRNALHRKEEEKLQKKDKRTLFGDGKAHVVTDDDFILVLEEIEEREKDKELGKDRRKAARAKAKESKEVRQRAWEQALWDWKHEREEWEQECEMLRMDGCRRKDLPKAPRKPRKADVILAATSNEDGVRDGDEDDDSERGDDEDSDAGGKSNVSGEAGDGDTDITSGDGADDEEEDDEDASERE